MFKIENNVATRSAIPSFLVGLAPSSLSDLSWTDPALGVQNIKFYSEYNNDSIIDHNTQMYGNEIVEIDDENQRVIVSHEVVSIPEEQIQATLQQKKNELCQRVTTMRDDLETQGFMFNGKLIESDSRSVQRINTVVQAAQVAIAMNTPFQIEWACADNSSVTLYASDILGLPVQLALHANSLHQKAKLLKSNINSISNIVDLNNFVITFD